MGMHAAEGREPPQPRAACGLGHLLMRPRFYLSFLSWSFLPPAGSAAVPGGVANAELGFATPRKVPLTLLHTNYTLNPKP